jgi:exodeoxyribonuclease V alpha subunit
LHAYAVTVHKSQGSEFPAVIMPLLTQHYIMLQRNLVYTAMTRARKLLIMIGTRRALAIALGNNTPMLRHTRLVQRLSLAPPESADERPY